jgi:cytochrome c553
MKKWAFIAGGLTLLLVLITLAAVGCAEDVAPTPGAAAESACITCHGNDSVLEAVAEEEEEVEAESEGEG